MNKLLKKFSYICISVCWIFSAAFAGFSNGANASYKTKIDSGIYLAREIKTYGSIRCGQYMIVKDKCNDIPFLCKVINKEKHKMQVMVVSCDKKYSKNIGNKIYFCRNDLNIIKYHVILAITKADVA